MKPLKTIHYIKPGICYETLPNGKIRFYGDWDPEEIKRILKEKNHKN